MRTIMFKRNNLCYVAEVILTVIEPLDDNKRQVVFFCQDKSGNRYRVPKSEVVISTAKEVVSCREKRKAKKSKSRSQRKLA